MSQIICSLDCETGGLKAGSSDLLTLYIGMLDEDYKILEELDLKLKPDNGRLPIAEAGALKVNGINLQAHMENPETVTYSHARELIVEMLKRHLKRSGRWSNLRVLGYNVDFDIKYIQHHILPESEWETLIHHAKHDPKIVVDFMKLCGWLPPDLGTLVSVVEYLKIPMRSAHSAKDDTLMTVEVFRALIELMKSKKENGSSQDLISLLESE